MKVLRQSWSVLSALPKGKWLFSKIFGYVVPYTGSMPFEVEDLSPGYARVALRDTWRSRNHLKSVHAMALANVGEAATGLALNFDLPDNQRSILTQFEMRYLKKARGRLVAECRVVTAVREGDVPLLGIIRNADGETVAEVRAVWKVSAKP